MAKINVISLFVLVLACLSCDKKTPETVSENQKTKDSLSKSSEQQVATSPKDSLLTASELNIISSISTNGNTEFFDKGKALTKYVQIELITQSLFKSKMKDSVSFVRYDTIPNKKKNSITELVCKAKTVKLIDKPDDNDSMEIYSYVGQIDVLNKYLVAVSYYESGEFFFIDKTTGAKTDSFGDFPTISPDKKHIISINANPYETTADMELFEIKNEKIKPIMTASFKNWMPLMEHGKIFWSNDGYLYLSVHNTKTYWTDDGNLNNKYQYIRLKLIP